MVPLTCGYFLDTIQLVTQIMLPLARCRSKRTPLATQPGPVPLNSSAVDRDDATAPLPDIIWQAQMQLALAEERYKVARESLAFLVRAHLRRARGLALPALDDACSVAISPDASKLTITARPEGQPVEHCGLAVADLAAEPLDMEERVEGLRATPEIARRLLLQRASGSIICVTS